MSLEDQIIQTEPPYGIILSRGHTKFGVELCEKLLEKDPLKRLSITSALKHSWFKMNFDITNRSAGNDSPKGEKLVLRRKISRVGSNEKLNFG